MTLIFNLLLLLFFLFFLYFLVKSNYKIVFLFGLLVYQAIAIVPSLIYIEEGIFISEQGRESYFVGATLAYVVYFIITFSIIFLTFGSLRKFTIVTPIFKNGTTIVDKGIIYYIAIISLAILFFNASQSRLPLFDESVSRFTYWELSKYPFLNKIFGNTSIFIPFILGILYKTNKTKSIFILLLYFLYNFFIGQKFSPIVSGLFSFFLPIIITSTKKFNINKFFTKKIIISFLIIFGTAYYVIYKKYEKTNPYAIIKIYDPNEAILYRAFGLQGHLMWGTTETYIYNDEAHSYDFMDFSMGMHRLMEKFAANSNNLEDAMKNGFNFTNGYPSILFYVYPVGVALVLHVFLTIVFFGFTGWLLMQLIINKSYVMAVILYQLFNWTIYAFTMGYFYKLKYIIIFLIFYAIYVIYNDKIKSFKKLKSTG